MKSLSCYGISDQGMYRKSNEDAWITKPELGFFAIADGMGGHNAGEVASKLTIESLSKSLEKIKRKKTLELILELRSAIEESNKLVFQKSQEDPEFTGMGTTLCCLLLLDKKLIMAHVGDSRIYRFRNGKLSLLTQDHSLHSKWLSTGALAQNCKTPYPYKHVITRSIGKLRKANPEIALATHEKNDLYLLLTDGLTDYLDHFEIEQILQEDGSLEKCSKELIRMAKVKGSSDNMTVVITKCA